MSDGIVANKLVVKFTRKSFFDHVVGVAHKWRTFLLTAVAIFGVWMTAEAPAYFLDAALRDGSFYLGGVTISLAGALFWTIRAYLRDCPVGLEHESPNARRIAQVQRARWEYRLARQLLQDVLLDLDDELAALADGRVFVPVERKPDPTDYAEWAGLGPANVLRMLEVAQQLLVLDLPTALGSPDNDGKPREIRNVVYRIRDLYRATLAFEQSRRSVEPPEGAERLHELQFGWTDPVRDGVRQMFGFFEAVLDLESIKDAEVAYTVTMDSPANVQKFNEELERLTARGLWQPG